MRKYKNIILEEICKRLDGLDFRQLEMTVNEICQGNQIFCDGLGRSGLSMRGFAMRLEQIGLKGILVGEATAPAFGKNDVLLICTASGASPTLLYHAKNAKKYGGKVLLITGRNDSDLAQMANGIILIEAPDKEQCQAGISSIQPMGTLFEQTSQLVCDIMTLELMDRVSVTTDKMRNNHANIE